MVTMDGAVVLTVEEWRRWREIRLRALADAPGAFSATLAEWSGPADREERGRARLENVALHVLWMAHDVDVGMISATEPSDGAVSLLSLWVDPADRGHGVGDRLVEFVRQWAITDGATRVELAVRADNVAAIGLYERHGFRVVGSPAMLGDPGDVRMELGLPAPPR